MLNLPVSDIMNDHPIKVRPDTSVRNVAHLLMRYRINGVLVVSEDSPDKLQGIFTTAELVNLMNDVMDKGAQKIQALNTLADRPVRDFLNPDFVSLQKDDSAAKAIVLMHKKNALTIPVYDGDKIIGVLGRHDVINIAFA